MPPARVKLRASPRLYIALALGAVAIGIGAWLVAGTPGAGPDLLIPSRVGPHDAQQLAQRVPIFPGSVEVGYKDMGASRYGALCHGRSAQVTLRGRIDVVWDVTRWYDRTLPPRGWQIFGGTDSRSAVGGTESFVEHGYITGRQSVGVWLPADIRAHAPRDSEGLTTWRIDYEVMDGDSETVAQCALAQIGPLGT